MTMTMSISMSRFLARNARRFLADTRGAAGIAAALLSMMFLGGTALVVDHLWLFGQRDVMKNAADASAVAATLARTQRTGSLDDDAWDEISAVATRYALLNLLDNVPASERSKVRDSLKVEVSEDTEGTIEVSLSADLGGTLLAGKLFDYDGPGSIGQRSGVEATITPVELVLAIDVTTSMRAGVSGDSLSADDPDSRLEIVKTAALNLLDVLEELGAGETAPFAAGVVPWNYRVRLGRTARTDWDSRGWAEYPAARTYPYPPPGKGPATPVHPERQALPARRALPRECRTWAGCPDRRPVSVATTALPVQSPFTMGFFPSQTAYTYDSSASSDRYISYGCQGYDARGADQRGWKRPACYDRSDFPNVWLCYDSPPSPWLGGRQRLEMQDQCEEDPELVPLTSNIDAVRSAIRALTPVGWRTSSSVGVEWGHRLLAPSWRPVWGDAVHPMASTAREDLKKVLVLLTDGQDNRPEDATEAADLLQRACTAAKNDGVLVFTIAALNTTGTRHANLAAQLRRCSSQADDPNGTYVFVNNATPDALRQAFHDIGRQLITMRRTY